MYDTLRIGNDLEETLASIQRAEQILQERQKKEADELHFLGKSLSETDAHHRELAERLGAIEKHVNTITLATVDDAARAFLYWTAADPAALGAAIAKVSKEPQ